MAKSANLKMRPLYIADYLARETNEEHKASVDDIKSMLAGYDIKADRKTIYNDIEELKLFGYDIEFQNGKYGGYYLASGDFELPELKLMVDAVQAGKFITSKKSAELIRKISGLVNKYDAVKLKRQVVIPDKIKADNEAIFIAVDNIHEAINNHVQIRFKYYEWNLNKELVEKHEGKIYRVSPFALIWDDENYYLVSYDEDAGKIKHFRVDKMKSIELTDVKAGHAEEREKLDPGMYSSQMFGMYGSNPQKVTLRCTNQMVGVIIDRFGKDVIIIKETNSVFRVNVNVAVSPMFYGWVSSFSGEIGIFGPQNVADEYRNYIKKIASGLL